LPLQNLPVKGFFFGIRTYPLSSDFYAVTLSNNTNPNVAKFLKWIFIVIFDFWLLLQRKTNRIMAVILKSNGCSYSKKNGKKASKEAIQELQITNVWAIVLF
jgi:hypothetical protein